MECSDSGAVDPMRESLKSYLGFVSRVPVDGEVFVDERVEPILSLIAQARQEQHKRDVEAVNLLQCTSDHEHTDENCNTTKCKNLILSALLETNPEKKDA